MCRRLVAKPEFKLTKLNVSTATCLPETTVLPPAGPQLRGEDAAASSWTGGSLFRPPAGAGGFYFQEKKSDAIRSDPSNYMTGEGSCYSSVFVTLSVCVLYRKKQLADCSSGVTKTLLKVSYPRCKYCFAHTLIPWYGTISSKYI